jgi:hypothetical protein
MQAPIAMAVVMLPVPAALVTPATVLAAGLQLRYMHGVAVKLLECGQSCYMGAPGSEAFPLW